MTEQGGPTDLDLNPELYDGSDESDAGEGAPAPAPGAEGPGFSDSDLEDVPTDISTYTIAFDTALQLVRLDFAACLTNTTEAQQSNLINYLDQQYLQVQRRFIKNISDFDHRREYLVFDLVLDVDRLVRVVWVSVSKHNKLFGQEQFLIRVLTDLEEYLPHYLFTSEAPSNAELLRLFSFFQLLDVRLSFLIDGYELDYGVQRIHGTEKVRLLGITMRLRVVVVDKLEGLRRATPSLLDLLDVEVGRLFEGLLERL